MKKEKSKPKDPAKGVTRRVFLSDMRSAVVSTTVLGPAISSSSAATLRASRPDCLEDITLTVNGLTYEVTVEPRCTLAEVLRDQLGLTGTKIGCDSGECGSCTVIFEGRPVYACSQLAVWADKKDITTIEGLAKGGQLDPLQEAFMEYDAPQCGFCTAGQLMSAKALLKRNPHPTRQQVQEALTGNLCRCANYNHIVKAVLAASQKG